MSSESRRSPGYYGAAVEKAVVERYGLTRTYREVGDSGVRMDAVTDDGQPVEIKAVAINRSGGRASGVTWKIWRDQHETLERTGGFYVFVLYRMQSDGIQILDMRSVRAGDIRVDWYGETQPRGSEQAEIPPSLVFG